MNNQIKFVLLALFWIDGPTLKQLSYIDIDISMPQVSIIIYQTIYTIYQTTLISQEIRYID